MPWITAKYRSTCTACEAPINEGDKIFILGKATYCEEDGKETAEEIGDVRETFRKYDRQRYNI